MFEMVAFATKPGTNSKPFRTANGVVIFHSKAVEKGATPELDKVIGHVVQVPYTTEEGVLQKAQLAVNMGQVEITVRDAQTLELLPQMFRPMPAAQAGIAPANVHDGDAVADVGQLQQALAEVEGVIKQLTDTGEAGAKDKIKALEAQRDALRASLQSAASQKATHDQAQTMQEMRQLQAEISKLSTQTDDASKAKVKELQARYAQLKAALKPQAPADTTPQSVPVPQAPKK
jgi:hypothetical protein